MIWLIAIAIVVFLCVLPFGISVTYHEDGFLLSLITGSLRFRLYPGKERKKKKQDEPAKKQTHSAAASQKRGGKVTDFIPLLETVLDFFGKFL